jgi:hypothetical protein
MYAFLVLLVAFGFLLLTLAVPFRFEACVLKLAGRIRQMVFTTAREALFDGIREQPYLGWTRVWGGTSAVLYAVFCVLHGSILSNELETVAAAGVYAALAMGVSAFVVTTCIVYSSFLTRLRGYATLDQCGFHGLWRTEDDHTPPTLREVAFAEVRDSKHVGILGVTGYEALGKGPGAHGGLLFDALAENTEVPVSILLLKPDNHVRDPERQQATIWQTVLSDTGMTPAAFQRKLEKALECIETLNESRPPEGRIDVHYYCEKPSFQGVIFDTSAIVAPCATADGMRSYSHFLARGRATGLSFFEIFRRQFARMWSDVNAPRKLPQPQARRVIRSPQRVPGVVRAPVEPAPVPRITYPASAAPGGE